MIGEIKIRAWKQQDRRSADHGKYRWEILRYSGSGMGWLIIEASAYRFGTATEAKDSAPGVA